MVHVGFLVNQLPITSEELVDSFLRQLLFVLHIDDICPVRHSIIFQYYFFGDDTAISNEVKCIEKLHKMGIIL